MSCVGLGDLEPAEATFERAKAFSPEMMQARLYAEGFRHMRREEDRHRASTLLRIATGLEDPIAADALRWLSEDAERVVGKTRVAGMAEVRGTLERQLWVQWPSDRLWPAV